MSTTSNTRIQKIKLSQWKEKLLSLFKQSASQNVSGESYAEINEKSKRSGSSESEVKQGNNPYLAARTEWNYMYNDVLKGKQNWQWVAVAMIIANLLLIFGFTRVSLQAKDVPYIVKVDKEGNAQFSGFLSNNNQQVSNVMVNAFIRRYIENVRSVIADPVAEKKSLDYVYAVTRGESLNFINAYFHSNDPFKHAKNSTIEVQIQDALPKSSQTWQIDWIETERNLEGGIINQSHYEALVTVEQKAVTDPNEMDINPLGMFVTRLSWSQQM